jgi:hypothetical protein
MGNISSSEEKIAETRKFQANFKKFTILMKLMKIGILAG